MNIPIETKPALLGAAAGAIALAIVGFTWGGWTTASRAETLAVMRSDEAVVTALAPLCVEKFEHASDAVANRAALKAADSWTQGKYVEQGGWAAIGARLPAERVAAVAEACAVLLVQGQ